MTTLVCEDCKILVDSEDDPDALVETQGRTMMLCEVCRDIRIIDAERADIAQRLGL